MNLSFTTNNDCLIPGTIFGGKYQIIKLIGQGGMGTVNMAYDIHLGLHMGVQSFDNDDPHVHY